MPCNDEAKEEEARWDTMEDTDLEIEHARKKVEQRLKSSLVICGVGAFGAVVAGLPGLLGGGGACLQALLDADAAVDDLELVLDKAELVHHRHFRALMARFMCLSRCSPIDVPEAP